MNQDDIFKDKLKALLGDLEAPPPEDGWEQIEQALNAATRIKLIRRNWYISSVAAVAVVLITGILFLNIPKTINSHSEQPLAKTEEPVKQEIAEKSVSDKFESETATTELTDSRKAASEEVKKTQTPVAKNEVLVSQDADQKIEQSENILISKQLTDSKNGKEAISGAIHTKKYGETSEDVQLTQEEIDRLIMEFANAGNIMIFEDEYSRKKKDSPIMLAINGKGALSGSQQVANNPMRLRSASIEEDINDDDAIYSGLSNTLSFKRENSAVITNNIADNVAKMDHAQPVSAGITISKNIIDKLAIETGIVYTYLHSRTNNSSINYSNRETQSFHYLGIPLNLNYYFANIGNLGLYASIGGMIEKDIYGKYISRGEITSGDLAGSSDEMITRKIKQENPQLSVNAGFGLSYPLYKGISLYGKVGGAYYFDAKNHQYKTIYSDKQINLDLNAGIKFDF